ncbi:hypothetical protein Taro_041540 [Colocasia esculenta]|uniref:Uncharacterized protein n=1 Tax=Colocasia esculenta TaxID=4460 RepID=A0A843WLY4_COLES|nr:hypothetical protein [Colocasia esculenta]
MSPPSPPLPRLSSFLSLSCSPQPEVAAINPAIRQRRRHPCYGPIPAVAIGSPRFGGLKLEILIRSAFSLFQHGRGDECDLWKLTEFNLDFQFELNARIHIKQVPSSSGVGGDEDEDENS